MACKVRKQQEGASHAIGSGIELLLSYHVVKGCFSLHFLLDHSGRNETTGIILSSHTGVSVKGRNSEAGIKQIMHLAFNFK